MHIYFVFGKLVDKSESRQCVDDFTSKSSLEYVRRFLILKVDKPIERDPRILCLYVWILSNQSRKHRRDTRAYRATDNMYINILVFCTIFLITLAWAAFVHTQRFFELLFSSFCSIWSTIE